MSKTHTFQKMKIQSAFKSTPSIHFCYGRSYHIFNSISDHNPIKYGLLNWFQCNGHFKMIHFFILLNYYLINNLTKSWMESNSLKNEIHIYRKNIIFFDLIWNRLNKVFGCSKSSVFRRIDLMNNTLILSIHSTLFIL